jgi:hypothetical protein
LERILNELEFIKENSPKKHEHGVEAIEEHTRRLVGDYDELEKFILKTKK